MTLTAVSTSSAQRRRPGGRSARVRQAVVSAALNQLLTVGYDGLSIRAVAKEAGVAESTVYRWWPTPADLATTAVLSLVDIENPIPDTGTLEGDLREHLTHVVALLNRPDVRRIVRAIAAIDDSNEAGRAARQSFWETRFNVSAEIVRRAVARSEVAAHIDADTVLEAVVAPAYFRALLLDRPLDQELVDWSVEMTLVAFAGGSRRQER